MLGFCRNQLSNSVHIKKSLQSDISCVGLGVKHYTLAQGYTPSFHQAIKIAHKVGYMASPAPFGTKTPGTGFTIDGVFELVFLLSENCTS